MEIPTRLQDEVINFVLLQKQQPQDLTKDFKGKGKAPIESGWQNKEIKWNSKELQNHLAKGWNYGVMGGGEKHLVIIDFDDEKVQEQVIPKLPKTFTVKTGGGLLHKYFFSDNAESFKVFTETLDTIADVQGKGKQVVCAGSKHPNNNYYEVVDDSPIAYIPYAEIKALMMSYDKKPKKTIPKPDFVPREYTGDFVEDVKGKISLERVLSHFGVNTSMNPTNCSLHDSKGGKCLGWDNETAHCFHCVHPKQEVITLNGIKNVKDVIKGDILINAFGEETKVKKVTKHKTVDKKMLSIYTRGNNSPLKITENHGCFYYKDIRLRCGKIRGKSYKLKKPTSFIGKISAKEITIKDGLFIPEIKIEKDYDYLLLPFKTKKGYKSRTNTIDKIPLNKDTLWMMGMYLAEGNSFRGGIKFSLHKEEENFANRIIKVFKELGINASKFNQTTPTGESLLVNICRTELSHSFKKLFGGICDKKKIPRELLFLPNSKLKYLLKGILDGDGSKRDFCIKQTSNQLSIDILIIGRKIGYFCSRSIDKKREGKKQTYSNYFSKKGFGKIKINNNQVNPVIKIKEEEYSQQVVDITVEGHPSFLTPQGIIGNCDGSWNIFSFVMDNKNCDFPEALEWICDNFGMRDEFEKHREVWKKEQRSEKLSLMTDKGEQAKIFAQSQPYFYDRNKIWWLWDAEEYKWELVDEVDILNMISRSCQQDVITSKARTETLNALKQEGRLSIPKPIKPTWIQFRNKIIDIETTESFEATPEYFVTNPIPYQMGEYPDTPTMDRIFEEWVGKKYVELLYEVLAYSLLPDMPVHRIFCFVGEGMNGKSKFLELLRKFIGKDNCCSTELDTLLGSRFEVTRLHKKLVCQMGETNFNEMNKTSLLKKLSGGDLIGFEYKNKNPFEENNYAKIIIATNNLPTTSDKTVGFYRRWCIIDFPNKFTEAKDILGEIPEEEYEALALRCVVTLKHILKVREFTNEGTIEERMERYESKSNFLEKFISENTSEELNGYITSADFYKKFKEWCRINRHRDMTERAVGLALKKYGWESGRKHFDWLFDGKGGRARVWLGVKWKDI